jgi:rhodanese-related sulfurtransferase
MSDEEYELPEVEPAALAEWLKSKPGLVLLDVREAEETRYAPLVDPRVVAVPLSVLARQRERALPVQMTPGAEVVVFCHVGSRSAEVTAWLSLSLGYTQVHNLRGGIDAYARLVDPSIPLYS